MRDLRVIEVAGGVAGAYCARLFAVTGADVVLVEPPGGAPSRTHGPHLTAADGTARSALHEHVDAGKRSVTIDLDGPDGDAVLAWADVVVATCDDACPVVPRRRYVSWQLPDPKGLPLTNVRRIRDEIARRVELLAGEL